MSLPIVPPAPGLFSTTTGTPSASWSCCMASRPVESVPPPGGRATMQRMGRLGHISARTMGGAASAAEAPARIARRVCFMDTVLNRVPWTDNRVLVVAAIDSRQATLDLHAVGSEDPSLVGGVGRL